MRKYFARAFGFAMMIVAVGARGAIAAEPGPLAYKMTASYQVGGDGGWDYATLGPDGHHLYVTRTTHTVLPDVRRGFISDGGDGSVLIFNMRNHAPIGKVTAANDADGIIYDHASNRVL